MKDRSVPSPWDWENKNPREDLFKMFPPHSEQDEVRILEICLFLQRQAQVILMENLAALYGETGMSGPVVKKALSEIKKQPLL